MFFKTKRKKQIDAFNQLRLLCLERNVTFFDVIINSSLYIDSYFPKNFELISDDYWKGDDAHLNRVIGISPPLKTTQDYSQLIDSIFQFQRDYSILHSTRNGWTITKKPPHESASHYEGLRKENRRLIKIFCSRDKDGKLTDMINDVYYNWESFEGQDTYMYLLGELNNLMSAYISEDHEAIDITWANIQKTMKNLSEKRIPSTVQEVKGALENL